jgi:hypothetical protein
MTGRSVQPAGRRRQVRSRAGRRGAPSGIRPGIAVGLRGWLSQISRHEQCFATLTLDPARRLAGILILLGVRDQDIGALTGECDRDRASDPVVRHRSQWLAFPRAGRDHGAPLPVIGDRLHPCSLPGRGLPLNCGILRHPRRTARASKPGNLEDVPDPGATRIPRGRWSRRGTIRHERLASNAGFQSAGDGSEHISGLRPSSVAGAR